MTTTFTLTVASRIAEIIHSVARREQKDDSLVASQLLEWAAVTHITFDAPSDAVSPANPTNGEDALPLELRQRQIRQIFERNEW